MTRRTRGAIGCLLALACEPPALVPDDGRCGPPEGAEALAAGGWRVEGDILVDGPGGMSEGAVSEGAGFRSAVKCGAALDRVWDVGRKLALTYCLGEFQDATLREGVARALVPATGQWERATGINFVHLRELDGTPRCRSPQAAAFVVHQGDAICDGGCPLASASFPPAGAGAAALVVYPEALQSELYTIETVLLHELGHLLGFVHEHSRFEQERGICVDAASTEFRGLTFPDPASVMGDARCPGIDEVATRGRLSAGDRLGAWILYGLPRARAVDFDGDGRHDFLWFSPGAGAYEVWFGEPGPGFAVERHGLCDRTGPCPAPPSWRPIALRGADGRSEVLMFGPRAVADERWRPNRRAPFERSRVVADSTAVPVVGKFGADGAEAVWWLEPGEPSVSWWEWTAERSIEHRRADGTMTGYGWPLVGRWRPGGEEVLWLDAQRKAVGLRRIGAGAQDMPEREGLPACGLRAGEQVPLVGDFDADGLDEALWWDPRAQEAVRWEVDELWDEDGRCRASGWSRLGGAGGLTARPVIGDFDGDGADEVLWVEDGATSVWKLGAGTAEVGSGPALAVDARGCVGDVDGDGCDDVLWFAPGQGGSPLWRSACSGDMRFETGQVLTPPAGAYPVGCG